MNITEFKILTDLTIGGIQCENGVIAVSKKVICDECLETGNFVPMIAFDDTWQCINCWSKVPENVMSENVSETLAECSNNCKLTDIIRNSW